MSDRRALPRRGAALASALLFGVLVALRPHPDAVRAELADAIPEGPRALLARAFSNRYDIDTREIVDIAVRNGSGAEQRRRLEVATKRIGGRFHSLGRFIEPPYLRGAAILSIENGDRSDDHFLYLRTLQRVRRLSSRQRADSFMGTGLTYEDFERRRVDDYDVRFLAPTKVAGDAVRVVEGLPRFDSAYARVEFFIAGSDMAILETRYYKRDAERPFKILHAPRETTRAFAGHLLPTYLRVENLARRTETEVWIEQLSVNPDLDDGLFTGAALEVGRPIPGLDSSW
jgi:hypothetical protein